MQPVAISPLADSKKHEARCLVAGEFPRITQIAYESQESHLPSMTIAGNADVGLACLINGPAC